MKDLIEALTLIIKYLKDPDRQYPTGAFDGMFIIYGIDFTNMTVEDARRLYEIGFIFGTDDEYDDDNDNNIPDVDEKSSDEELQAMIDYAIENDFFSVFSFRFGSC